MNTKDMSDLYTPLEYRKLREQRVYEIVQKCLVDQVACVGAEGITRQEIRGWIDLAVVLIDELEKQ